MSIHIITLTQFYEIYVSGTNRYFRKIASKFGVETDFVDCTVAENVQKAMKPNTRVRVVPSSLKMSCMLIV